MLVNLKSSTASNAYDLEKSMKQVISFLVIPITLVTLGKQIHFAFKIRKSLDKSLPYIIMELNTLFVWLCSFLENFLNITLGASVGQWFLAELLVFAYYLDFVGVFIYTWSFIDVVLADKDIKFRRVFSVYR